MATLNQKRTAKKVKEVIESGQTMDQKDILAFIGYGKGIQKNPRAVFGSKGFKEALKNLGFSLEAADMTVAKILRTGREDNQLKASDQIYKRLGGYAPEKKDVRKIVVNVGTRAKTNKALTEFIHGQAGNTQANS